MKDLVKPPFATYDVVVYFGAGLFAVPFLIRYLAVPLGLPDPAFLTEESDQVAFEIVRILTIITFVYVLGHIIAFFSSHLIEKALGFQCFFDQMTSQRGSYGGGAPSFTWGVLGGRSSVLFACEVLSITS